MSADKPTAMPSPSSTTTSRNSLSSLMHTFATVLREVGAADVAQLLPWVNDAADLHLDDGFPDEVQEHCVQAYSIAFQLLNASQENVVAQQRRAAEHNDKLVDDPGSWDQVFAAANAKGVSAVDVADALKDVRVEPVLTAHPTEAKRQTVLDHHRQLYCLLVELENSMWTTSERNARLDEVAAVLERLWRTGEIYLEKPSLASERTAILHHLRRVFPVVLPWFSQRLRAAWARAGWDPAALDGVDALPRLSFGDWVGGDRDGHPGVTADVTADTLALFHREAINVVDEHLERLAVRLSLSRRRQQPPANVLERIAQLAEMLGDEGAAQCTRNTGEPWRQLVNLCRVALRHADVSFSAADLVDHLQVLHDGLCEAGAQRLARVDVEPVLQAVSTFGFHLAVLDVRQNSAFHDKALAQLLALAGVDDAASYPTWSVERRRALLDAELATRRPFASAADVTTPEAKAVLDAYRTLASHRAVHGDAGLGALIVSMTRSLEDLLAVYVLGRDAGLLLHDDGEVWCPLEVVPLLETIDDLEAGPAILHDMLSHPVVKASLRRRQQAQQTAMPVQQVMIGYSDSGKDGGIVCSFWTLYRAQSRLAAVGREHGVRIRFFHGKGGTIGRGAGPTHRFVKALPPHSVGGDLRLTEQGESIAQKYANRVTAAHHLELLAAGALRATLADDDGRQDPPELLALLDGLADRSRKAYRALLDADGFVSFFEHATPLDVIESSRIGSRPARRTGKRSLSDLRAIPWVFSWNQSRFGLPGWYGLGTALMALRDDDKEGFDALVRAKAEATRWNPWHYLISNAATAHMTSDLNLMQAYASLVPDDELRERILQQIVDEHRKTKEALELIYAAPLSTIRPNIDAAIRMRHEALLPLHKHQIALLRRWRATSNPDEAEPLLLQLLLTVNAIASGLGATG